MFGVATLATPNIPWKLFQKDPFETTSMGCLGLLKWQPQTSPYHGDKGMFGVATLATPNITSKLDLATGGGQPQTSPFHGDKGMFGGNQPWGGQPQTSPLSR